MMQSEPGSLFQRGRALTTNVELHTKIKFGAERRRTGAELVKGLGFALIRTKNTGKYDVTICQLRKPVFMVTHYCRLG